MKVLITGAAGFIGGYLVRHCVEAGASVLGLDIRESEEKLAGAAFELCDVLDSVRLPALLSKFRPDRIFHLAAQSYPSISWIRPRETMNTNAGGTINLLETIRELGIRPTVVVACSSAEYGSVAPENLPIRETQPLCPVHPYGASKAAQDFLAAQYFSTYAIPTIRIRIFNTTGPGKLGDVCSDLTKRAVEIEMGIRPPSMPIGNLTSRRSIVDARDLVRALWLSVEHCLIGNVYNLGGDDVYSVQGVVEAIRTQVAIPFDLEQRADLMRSGDEPAIVGDNGKFRTRCTWIPAITLAAMLHDMLGWWRIRLAGALQCASSHKA